MYGTFENIESLGVEDERAPMPPGNTSRQEKALGRFKVKSGKKEEARLPWQ